MPRPRNFSYLIEEKIAGSGHPGAGEELGAVLNALREEGFRAIVSLCETPLESAMLEEFGVTNLHLPVRDFTAPALCQIEDALDFLRDHLSRQARVLVHCAAGYGRTGTILACYLVAEGSSAEEAMQEVRRVRPGSIEDVSQEKAIAGYERHLLESAARESSRGET